MASKTASPSRNSLTERTGPGAIVRAMVNPPVPTCECGQALDVCDARYCPRCGVTVDTKHRGLLPDAHSRRPAGHEQRDVSAFDLESGTRRSPCQAGSSR